MIELLSDQAIFGLSEEESAELEQLKRRFPDWEDESFDQTAALIELSNFEISEPMPAHLRERILADSEKYFSAKDEVAEVSGEQGEGGATIPQRTQTHVGETVRTSDTSGGGFGWNWLGWAVATVAVVALGINLWSISQTPQTEIAGQNQMPTVTPTPTLNERYNQLLASGNTIKTNFSGVAYQEFDGEVVWSNDEQKGFMRLRNLPVNDKTKEQYQLWIVDAEQGVKTPVDGGVFDVAETGEVIVPFDAPVKVSDPKAFAITVEKPGGVVVSKQEKVAGLAKV